MSAGRYEVFIIGPMGRRFRSRNEIKTYFEKMGDQGLNHDDFDFSTFGNGKVMPESNATSAVAAVAPSPAALTAQVKHLSFLSCCFPLRSLK